MLIMHINTCKTLHKYCHSNPNTDAPIPLSALNIIYAHSAIKSPILRLSPVKEDRVATWLYRFFHDRSEISVRSSPAADSIAR